MDRIQTFWNWFKSRSEYIFQQLENDTDNIALEITEHLKVINEDLAFEIPLDFDGDQREFIISADGLIELFELVIDLVKSAPKLNNWKITAFRPRLHQRNQVIDLDGITMDYNDVFFDCKVLTEGIEIDAYINNFDGKDNRFVHLYFLLLDSLIGEFDSVKYIISTTVHILENKRDLKSFPDLLKIIDKYKNNIEMI
jgi:hypothetical protein